jgi:hypothetical protein
MLIGCRVRVLVGVMVGLAVAGGCGVLLGEDVIVGVWVVLGITIVAAGTAMTVLVGGSTFAGRQPVKIENRNRPNAIPANSLNLFLLLPVNSIMMNGSSFGKLL